MSVGNIEVCPLCGEAIVNKYTRVVGFLTKVSNWIKERREIDFPNRQFYKSNEV
jgi:ribonucleoside-triphosphate reductase